MWLYLPKQFVPSSAELADSMKQSDWQPQEVKLWFMSSGKAMQSPLSAKRWKTRSWTKLLSGATLPPSMAELGVERYLASLGGFHVPTSQSQAKKKESSKATGQASSTNTSALLAKFDPDTSSWRTSQASLITMQWELYSENFPKSGCLVNGECFQRPEWVAPINVNESLRWGTPNTMDTLPSRSYEAMKRQARNGARKNRTRPGNLREQVDPLMHQAYADARAEANWRTPSASDPVGGVKDLNSDKYKNAEAPKIKLRDQSASWPTPSSQLAGEGPLMEKLVTKDGEPMQLGERAYNPETGNHVQMTLNRVTSAWPTPRAVEIDESLETHGARMAKRTAEGKEIPSDNLSIASKKWRTPLGADGTHNHGLAPSVLEGKTTLTLSAQVLAKEEENKKWPTPAVCMVKGAYSEEAQTRKDGKSRTMDRLDNAVLFAGPCSQNWLTPAAREDAACPQSQRMLTHQAKEFPCKDLTGPQDPMTGNNGSKPLPSDPTSLRLSKRLNPRFVEWLMGHPIGWSSVKKIETKDYNAWETASSHLLERLLSGSCGKG